MDCAVCGIRSSTGYCVECQTLLCEECGIACETCGKLVCPEHVEETRSGKRLCATCMTKRREERRKRKKHKEDEDTSFAALDGEGEGGEEEPDEEAILTVSARRGLEPWQWSLILGISGVVVILILLIFPSWRRIPMGPETFIPTTIFTAVFPLFSIIWAVTGIVRIEYDEDRAKCYYGIALSALTLILIVVAVVTDPARNQRDEAQSLQEQREGLSEEELEDWRQQQLERYSAPAQDR